MTPLNASSPASTASPTSSESSESRITLWTRLWQCTRSQAVSRIAATRQIMTLRSAVKVAANDRKWEQVKHIWERQGVGRLEWEHLDMVGGFGGDGDAGAFWGRGKELNVRGAPSEEDANNGAVSMVGQHGHGDVPTSPSTSTSTSGSPNMSPMTTTIPLPPPPPSPSSLQSQQSTSISICHTNQSSTAADGEIFQAALTLVDAHGVDRSEAIAKAVWIVLRNHLECVRSGGECADACLVCRLIQAKFVRIREACGSNSGHEGEVPCGEGTERDLSTVANASSVESLARSTKRYAIGNVISAADAGAVQAAQLGVEPGAKLHELDASETCSKRSTIDDASTLHLAALPASTGQNSIPTTSNPAAILASPHFLSITSGRQSYQYQPARPSRAIVFDSLLHPPDHSARTRMRRVVPGSARSRSEPCLSDHPIHECGRGDSPLESISLSRGRVNMSPCGSPSSTVNDSSTDNGSAKGSGKQSPLRAIARFVGDKSKQLLPANFSTSFVRPFPRSAPVSPVSPPPPLAPQPLPVGMAPSAVGGTGHRRSSYAILFSPRPDGARGHGRFGSFSPLCSPGTVDAAVDADLLLREQIRDRNRDHRDAQNSWSSVLGSSSSAAAAKRWARRNAGRLVGGGGRGGVGDAENNANVRKKSWRSAGGYTERDGMGLLDRREVKSEGGAIKEGKRHRSSWSLAPRRTTPPVIIAMTSANNGLPDTTTGTTSAGAQAQAPRNRSFPLEIDRPWLPPTPRLGPVSPSSSSSFSPLSTDPPRLSLCLSLAPLPDLSAQDRHPVAPLPPLPIRMTAGAGSAEGRRG